MSGMQGDTLLFDMSSATEGTPSVFVRRDWLSIMDNMNQNYVGNQSIIDTSQLANSNKYMSYYEATLIVPLTMTLTSATGTAAVDATTLDLCMGLKNWLGSIVHSFTLDYNGTTIIQQTPLVGLWNTFCLITSFNYNDFTEWASIGFYPDSSTSWKYQNAAATSGVGVCNNGNLLSIVDADSAGQGQATTGNIGFLKRQQYWAFDPTTTNGGTTAWGNGSGNDITTGLISNSSLNNLYKSYIFKQQNETAGGQKLVVQQAITGQIKLRHLHNFFQEVPLLKGVFMKMTMNLNSTSATLEVAGGEFTTNCTVNVPLGGVSPLMVASGAANNGSATLIANDDTYIASVSVGSTCLNNSQTSVAGVIKSPMLSSIMLNVPSYVFNPIYEQAYLSNSVKTIVYNDLYQYQVINVAANAPFNNLITNGIAGIQTVLVLPFATNVGAAPGNAGQVIKPFQSPFTSEGGGTTSPLCLLTNFNVVISGQNAIYNTERYTYEQFTQQLYGINAVNGGLTDGVNSGLINQLDFETMYNYYAVNVSRCLPIEEAVPKSVNIIGTNSSQFAIDLYVFISYKTSVSIDILTGSRV